MMFEDQLVSLNPAYNVELEKEVYSVTRDPDYIDLTSPFGLDILVLCGRNGVGKTTLLRIFENRILPGDPDFNIVWKDKNDALLSKSNIAVTINGRPESLMDDYSFDSIMALCANGAKQNKPNSFRGGLVGVYSHNPNLYDQALGKKIFDGFYVDYETDCSSFDHLEESVSRKLGVDFGMGGFRDIVREHPTMHVLAWLCSINVFDHDLEKLQSRGVTNYEALCRFLSDDKSRGLDKSFLELIRVEPQQPKCSVEALADRIRRIDPNREEKSRRYYSLSEYSNVREKVRRLSQQIGEWVMSRFPQVRSHAGDILDEEILWFRPFKRHADGTISGMWDLSDGERLKLNMAFSLIPFLIQRDGCWFHFDDWEGELHPEWKRKFIYELLITYRESVKAMRKVTGRSQKWAPRQTCVISTHSPFLLSDLLPQNILLLTMDEDGKTSIRRGENRTFGGNIGELFHTEFFMETTIGEFARREIQRMLKKLKGNPRQQTVDSAKRLFENVGDEVLRSLLMEKVQNAAN